MRFPALDGFVCFKIVYLFMEIDLIVFCLAERRG